MSRKSDKRERLLDAAATIFWMEGYAATSLADIARESEVPLGNIYYYFKTKTAIADGVADIYVTETLSSLATIDKETDHPSDKIQSFITLMKESTSSRTKLGCPLARSVRDFADVAPSAAERVNQVFDILIGWLGQILNKAGDRHAIRHARIAIARWQGAIILAHAARDETALVEALTELEADLLSWART